MPIRASSLSEPSAESRRLRQLITSCAPPENPVPFISHQRWEVARLSCQLFRDAVAAAAFEVEPFLPKSSCEQLIRLALRERLAAALIRILTRLPDAMAVRFEERRIVDNECFVMVVTDILTGQVEDFGWDYSGGRWASRWMLERLLGLADQGDAS